MSELDELALELERVIPILVQGAQFLAGWDQVDTARDGLLKPKQSQLRTRLEHATTTVDRIVDRLRDMAHAAVTNPPPAGPPLNRDSGPI